MLFRTLIIINPVTFSDLPATSHQ